MPVSGAPNRRAVRPARGGGGADRASEPRLFLRMPGRSAANRMRQCTNAKTVTTSFVRVHSLVALPGGPVRARTEALHRRNSPPTHRIRYVMAPAGFTTHSMHVMHRKRAAPRCPSTQPAAGSNSPCGRLVASERMLDDRVGAGRAGFVTQAPCQRCVSHSSCSRPLVRFLRMRTCKGRVAELPPKLRPFFNGRTELCAVNWGRLCSLRACPNRVCRQCRQSVSVFPQCGDHTYNATAVTFHFGPRFRASVSGLGFRSTWATSSTPWCVLPELHNCTQLCKLQQFELRSFKFKLLV